MGSILRLPGWLRRNYATKFLVGLLLVTVVAGGVGGFVYVNAGNQLQEATEDELTTTASLQRDQIDEWYRSTTSDSQSLRVNVRNQLGQGDSTARIETLLSTTVSRREHVVGAYYVDADTGDVSVAAGDQRFIDPSADDRVRDGIRERVVVAMNESGSAVGATSPFRVGDDQTPVMAFGTAVDGDASKTIVLVADLQSVGDDYLLDPDAGEVVVTDSDGRRLMSTADDGALLAPATTAGFDPSAGATRDGSTAFESRVDVDVDGRSYAVGSAVGESVRWTVATRVPTTEAYALQTAISNQMLALVVLVFASLAVLGMTLGRNTVSGVRDLSNAAERLRDGDLEASVPTERADEIGDLGRAFDEMRASLRERIREVEAARTDAEAARQEAETMRRHLERKADEYEVTMTDVAEGDLTARLDPASESEAMTSVATATNDTLDAIEATVADVKSFAAAVEAESESAAGSSSEVERASEQVSESVQEISVGADRQHENLESVSAEMESLSTSTEQIAATTNDVADRSERTATVGREGRNAAEAAIEGMAAVEAESAEAVDAIESLEAEMAAIDELVEFISEVAHQTNMLALNANIEASRGASGDAGEGGFAVVAQEVKDLAQETKDAAADVEERLERIRSETDRTAAEVRGTREQVAANAADVREAASALDEVAEYARETNEGVQEISAATEEQAASTEAVVAIVEEATTISEETSAEAETVAAAAEEQTANLSAVSTSADRLASQARALAEHLAAFDVAAGSGGVGGSPNTGAVDGSSDSSDAGRSSDGEGSGEFEFGFRTTE